MTRPARLGRRLLPAVLIAILTSSILVGVVGAGNANSQTSAARRDVQVPVAHLGDKGSYSLDLKGPWLDGPFAHGAAPFANFSFGKGEPVRMADGLVHATDRGLVEGMRYDELNTFDFDFDGKPDHNPWESYHGAILFEQGSSQVWASESNRTTSNVTDGGLLGSPLTVGGLPEVIHSQIVTHEKSQSRSFGVGDAFCLFVNPAQGRTFAVGASFLLEDTCTIGEVATLPAGTYQAKALDMLDGRPALRFDASRVLTDAVMDFSSDEVSLKEYQVSVWFASGISSPLKLEARSTDDNGDHATMVLVSYAPGTVARTLGPAPRDPIPGLVMAPSKPWGPDDKGLNVPLLPSEAWNQAMTDPSFSGLRDFRAAHPKAYTTVAFSVDLRGPAWWFHEGDGHDSYSVIVYILHATGLPPPMPQHVFSYIDFGSSSFDWPVPPEPKELPTWVSLADRWRDYATAADGAHPSNDLAYAELCGFRFTNGTVSCSVAVSFTRAGWVESTSSGRRVDTTTTPPTIVEDAETRMSALAMVNGEPSVLETSQENSSVRNGLQGAAATKPSGIPPASGSANSIPGWLPNPAQAAGISLVGLFVGALYWVWPILKGGSIGLFSRLRNPELLDNPHRARLAALIEADAGIHFQELGRRSGLPNGTLVHHLSKLTEAGLVVARPSGGYTCYFPRGAGRMQIAAAPAMKSDGARSILAVVAAQPGLTSQEVAQRSGLQASTVTYHVKRLIDGGLVVTVRDGRFLRLHPSALASTMAPHQAGVAAS